MASCMKDNLLRAISMERESTGGKTGMYTQASSNTIKDKASESTYGQIQAYIKASGMEIE